MAKCDLLRCASQVTGKKRNRKLDRRPDEKQHDIRCCRGSITDTGTGRNRRPGGRVDRPPGGFGCPSFPRCFPPQKGKSATRSFPCRAKSQEGDRTMAKTSEEVMTQSVQGVRR